MSSNLKEEYTDHGGDDTDLRLIDDASDGGNEMDYPLDSQLATDLTK